MFTTFNSNLKFIQIISILASFFFSGIPMSDAQKLNWAVEPIITDADEIKFKEINNNELYFIKVKKGNSWGMKNIKNDLILPLEYESTSIWSVGYCEGRNGQKQSFFDKDGYEVEFDEIKALRRKESDIETYQKINKIINDLNEAYPRVSFSTRKVGKFYKNVAVNKETGDTISNDFHGGGFFMTSTLHSMHTIDKKHVVLDGNGNVVKTLDNKLRFVKREGDRMIYRIKNLKALYDENYDEVLPMEYESMFFINENYLKVSKEGSDEYIIDKNGKKVHNSEGSSIYSLKDGTVIIKKNGFETGVLNQETGTVKLYNWRLRSKPLTNSKVYRITNKDTLNGLFDFETNTTILDCKYRTAKTQGSYYIVGDYRLTKRQRVSNYYALKSVYNAKGDKIIEDSIKGLIEVTPDLIFTTDNNGIYTEYDGQGNVRNKHPEGGHMFSVDGKFISMQPKGQKKYIPISDYLLGNDVNGYTSISKPQQNKDKTKKMYTVMNDGKIGAIDENGNILIPVKFDKLEIKYYNKYIPVYIDQKWGILYNPIYTEI